MWGYKQRSPNRRRRETIAAAKPCRVCENEECRHCEQEDCMTYQAWLSLKSRCEAMEEELLRLRDLVGQVDAECIDGVLQRSEEET